ncbi:hypothetical protein F4775DRAFT_449121 [Biscogniauxia sp. FL1348]|nr:hypothetical protein F4775DRAFT_449121 [Biscogniauxia sp. FL1348]
MAHNRGLLATIIFSLFITLASPRSQPPAGLAALDDAAFTPNFAPRWYMDAVPASPALARRQDTCSAGQHSCLELGALGARACCANDHYCIVNSTWQVQCCAAGSSCDPTCDAEHFLCNATSTSSITQTTIATATFVETVVIPLPVTSAACCSRACNTSQFLCAPAFGQQCCPLGATCASGGACVVPASPTTTDPISTRVTEVPEGCTTSQITCASADGGGCCNLGSTCTWQRTSSTAAAPVCAPNLTVADSGGGSSAALSSAARAGIGAGVAVGAALVIAALTWFCLRRRHRGGVSEGGAGSGPAAPAGAVGMRYLDTGEASESLVGGRGRHRNRNRSRMTPTTRALSDGSSAVYRDGGGGGGHDYFGPDAVAGPYTEDANVAPEAGAGAGAMTSPGARSAGVPVLPMDPDDIVPPVEIDSRIRDRSIGSRNEEIERDMMLAGKRSAAGGAAGAAGKGVARRVDGSGTGSGTRASAQEDEKQGPFELYGSPPASPPLVSPPMSPPMSPDYFPRQAMSPSPEMGSRYSGER